MITGETGWAVATDQNNDDHILFTSDGGLTWEERNPPEPGSPMSQAVLPFFLDELHAWAVFSSGTFDANSYTIPRAWQTQDGGQTWRQGEPADFDVEAYQIGYPTVLTFLDPDTGWLVLNHGAAAGTSPNSIFMTSDGGMTWNTVKAPFSDLDEGFDICCGTGLAFLNENEGLATKDPGPVSRTYYVMTQDSGTSWIYHEPSPGDQDLYSLGGCTSRSPLALGTAPAGRSAASRFREKPPPGAPAPLP